MRPEPKSKPKKLKPGTGEREPNGEVMDTREKILEAAGRLFIEYGYDGVSISDVAMAAGTAKALVFYYFKSKQKLFESVLGSYQAAQAKLLMGAFNAQGSHRDRIHAGIDAYLEFIKQNPGYPRLLQGEICSNSKNLPVILEHMKPIHQWGTSVLGKDLPQKGPLSAKRFYMSIFSIIVNYYTYTPLLEQLWGLDPMNEKALSEQRRHLMFIVDTLLDRVLPEAG